MKAIDITGQVFGRLTVTGRARSNNHGIVWKCKCSCGNDYEAYGDAIRQGRTKSCGCWHREHSSKINKSHGLSQSPEYKVWEAMKHRCSRPHNKHYANYGGRGIGICKRWHKFENFFNDMGKRPSPRHTIERIDNDGHYCKSNCKWATRKEQQNNMRTNRRLAHNGETLTVPQWAERTGISAENIRNRLRLGWSIEKVLETVVR